MWVDSCHWTRSRLPLVAGDDLIGNDRRRAQRHLISCPGCRRRLDDLHVSQGVLHTAAAAAPARAEAPSLWPEVARQIREHRHPAVSASWGVSWSNVGFWSGTALAAGLVVVAGVFSRPGPAPVAQVTPETPQVPQTLVSTPPRPAPARSEEPGALWTSEQDALAFAQEPRKTPEPAPAPRRGDEPTDRSRDGAPEVQPTR